MWNAGARHAAKSERSRGSRRSMRTAGGQRAREYEESRVGTVASGGTQGNEHRERRPVYSSGL